MRVNLCGEKWCQLLSPCLLLCRFLCSVLRLGGGAARCLLGAQTPVYAASFMVGCRYLHFIFACGERKCKLIYYAQATECRTWQKAGPVHATPRGRLLGWLPGQKNTRKNKRYIYTKKKVAKVGKSSIEAAAWQLHSWPACGGVNIAINIDLNALYGRACESGERGWGKDKYCAHYARCMLPLRSALSLSLSVSFYHYSLSAAIQSRRHSVDFSLLAKLQKSRA